MITYPPPDSLSIFDKTLSLNIPIYRNDEHKNLAQYSCEAQKLYMVFCTLILHNQTVFHAGFYDATFKNSQGNVTFMFEIKEETDLSTPLLVTEGKVLICIIIQLMWIEMHVYISRYADINILYLIDNVLNFFIRLIKHIRAKIPGIYKLFLSEYVTMSLKLSFSL